MHRNVNWRLVPVITSLLLVIAKKDVVAACIRVNNEELLEYNCEGGSLEDRGWIMEVPDNIEKIRISNVSVGRLDETLLSHFGSSLLAFACSHCSIKEISDGAFKRLHNLQQLSLDNNHLTKVRASWFDPGLLFLTYLDLNYNQIESLDTKMFGMVPSLVDLRLSGNQLDCLDLQALSLLHDLKRIFLNENSNFGCPNALGKYLRERGIDYEPDPQWANQSPDRLHIHEPYSPERSASTVATTALQSPATITLSPFPSRLLRTFDSLQPSSRSQEFDFNQSIYYESTTVYQKPNNYQSMRNSSRHLPLTTSPSIVITAVLPTDPTTTECANGTAFSESTSHYALIIIATLLGFSFFT